MRRGCKVNMWGIGIGTDFDTEKFINEIRIRPAIWNSKCPEYVDRELKIQAWNEIVDEYTGDEDLTRDERKKLCLHIQKKWRNIRDCFVKTHKAKLKNKKVTYSLYEDLLFLTETLSLGRVGNDIISNNVITVDGIKNEIVHNIQMDPLSVVTSVMKRKRRRVDNSSESGDSGVSNRKEKNQEKEKEEVGMEEDEDRLFCLSLVKEFGKIPEHLRIQAKIDLLKVIKDAQFPNWAGHVVSENSYQY